MSTSLLLPSNGSYHPMAKGISYYKDYHRKWKCREKMKNKYMNTTKLHILAQTMGT
jgi:hypothetical protein